MEEALWVKILILIAITAIVILTGFNAATYNKIANENLTLDTVTPGEARTLMWFNIIILLLTIPLWIWYIYKIFRNQDQRDADILRLKEYIKEKAKYSGQPINPNSPIGNALAEEGLSRSAGLSGNDSIEQNLSNLDGSFEEVNLKPKGLSIKQQLKQISPVPQESYGGMRMPMRQPPASYGDSFVSDREKLCSFTNRWIRPAACDD